MTIADSRNGIGRIYDDNGEVVDEFESSGCIYNDLGMCQGCPTCRFDDDVDDFDDEFEAYSEEFAEAFGYAEEEGSASHEMLDEAQDVCNPYAFAVDAKAPTHDGMCCEQPASHPLLRMAISAWDNLFRSVLRLVRNPKVLAVFVGLLAVRTVMCSTVGAPDPVEQATGLVAGFADFTGATLLSLFSVYADMFGIPLDSLLPFVS